MVYITVVLTLVVLVYIQSVSLKTSLFLVSFSPLFIILSVKIFLELQIINYVKLITHDLFWLVVLILGILPLIIFASHVWISIKLKKNRLNMSLSEPEQLGDGIISYVMTYIVPLTSLSYSSSDSEYLSNILLFLLIMVLYIRMDLVFLNPILIILGLNIYKAKGNGEVRYYLTTYNFQNFKSIIKDGDLVLIKLSNSLYFLKKYKTKI